MFKLFKPRPGIDASNNVGNFIFGDVTGNVTQMFIQGAVSEPPTLPWRDMPSEPDVFRLLSWRTRLAPLIGRDTELKAVLDWSHQKSGVKVRFLSGPGGAGKSRLAAEAAQRLRDEGWTAGFASLDQPRIVPVTRDGLLLILDYAEEKRQQTVELLSHLARVEDAPSRIRVLFLSRRDPDWWRADIDAAHAAEICDGQQVAVELVGEQEALAVVEAVQDRVIDHLGVKAVRSDPQAVREWREQNPSLHGLPLFIHAAAIHAVLEQREIRLAGAEVMRALVRRERLRIDNIGRASGFGAQGAGRLVGLAAASGSFDETMIRQLANPQLELGVPAPEHVIDAVALLPHWEDHRLPAITPGILGSGFLLEILSDRPDRAPDWLWTVLSASPPEWVHRMERLSYDIEILHGPKEQHLSTWLVQMVDRDHGRAMFLEPVVAQRGPRATLGLALAVARILLEDSTRNPADRASVLMNMSNLLPAADDLPGAIAAIIEAIKIYEALAEADHNTFDSHLASSLNNLANRLSEAGDRTGALEAIRKAVDIQTELVRKDPIEAGMHLAGALTNMSAHLSEAGEVHQSIEVARQAIAQYRNLLAANQPGVRANLAVALDNLSQLLFTGGEAQQNPVEALDASREAVQIHERLAADDPRFEPELIGSLRVLSNRLASVNDPNAMPAATRAVNMSRRLAGQDPRRYGALLAISYETLAARYVESNDLEAAIGAIRDAEEIFREIAGRRPEIGAPDLARTLAHLTTFLRLAGRRDESIATGKDAIGIWEQLANAHPLRFTAGFIQICNEVSIMLRHAGEFHSAAVLGQAAVARARWLAARQPGTYDYELAVVLGTLHSALVKLGDASGALVTIEESAGIFRRLAQNNPEKYEESLAEALMKQFAIIYSTQHLTQDEAARHPVFLESVALLNRLKEKSAN
jgi:tetratricopeptide (TPR) repeat protein